MLAALWLTRIAVAIPPSSTLTGDTGTLVWTVQMTPEGVVIDGHSPRWTVHHLAGPDLQPLRTERQDADGRRVTVDYTASGAVVRTGDQEVRVSGTDLWDGDTVDLRLGELVARGRTEVSFSALDAASGKVYGFAASVVGRETCGAVACTRVRLAMTGLYRLVGPTWDYAYAADGRLLRFQGPIGTFTAAGAR